MSFLGATWILFADHLRWTLRSRRLLLCALLVLLPVAAAWLVSLIVREEGPAPAGRILWLLEMQVVVPLAALLLGSAVVSEEVEDRTITYLVTRPIPRPSILVGRWLAALVVLAVLLAASSALVLELLEGSGDAASRRALAEASTRVLATIVLGGAVYSALFAAASAFFKHPMMLGLGYVFAVEALLANLPGSNQSLTVQYYLKSFVAGGDPFIAEQLRIGAIQGSIAPGDALVRLAAILVAALALGSWRMARREYVLAA